MFSYYGDDSQNAEVCRSLVENKKSYCKRHGILWTYRRFYFLPHRHRQEALAMEIVLAYELLLSAHNQQVTYMDFDTFIVDHAVDLDPIFEKTDREHNFPCTIYVQADPYLANTGFWSLMNTDWVRETFVPKWEEYRRNWNKAGLTGAVIKEPDQKSFGAALLYFALREKGLDGDMCGLAEFNLHSEKMKNVTGHLRQWTELLGEYPGQEWHTMSTRDKVTGFQKGSSTYADLLDKHVREGDSGIMYDCYNWVFEWVLGKPFQNRSFPVGNNDGVCFLGFEGKQMNRQHYFPPSALKKLRNFQFSQAHEKRHFGKALVKLLHLLKSSLINKQRTTQRTTHLQIKPSIMGARTQTISSPFTLIWKRMTRASARGRLPPTTS